MLDLLNRGRLLLGWYWVIVGWGILPMNVPHLQAEVYHDVAFWQDFSIKCPLSPELSIGQLDQVRCDRDAIIHVRAGSQLLQPYRRSLVRDTLYRPLLASDIRALEIYRGQRVYLTAEAVLSNAWAGKFYLLHGLPDARLFAMGQAFDVLIASADHLVYFQNNQPVAEKKLMGEPILQLVFNPPTNRFLVLTDKHLDLFNPRQQRLVTVYRGTGLTALAADKSNLWLGTSDGLIRLDPTSFAALEPKKTKLPWPHISCLRIIDNTLWCGTPKGAFSITAEDRISYYASQRWLLDDHVSDIAPGPDKSVLILTRTRLNRIQFQRMSLKEKAAHYERLTRKRHNRYGLNSRLTLTQPGDLSTGQLTDQDNEGLWTSLYLAAELFRYRTTGSDAALKNCYESFEALERLESITSIKGLPARSFERRGFEVNGLKNWQHAKGGVWDWKATTSSDEIVGHFFAYSLFAEFVPDTQWRQRAISLMTRVMDYIIEHDWYLIDYDGNPYDLHKNLFLGVDPPHLASLHLSEIG